MLALLAYEIIAQQVAWVHNGANDAFHLFANPVDAAMYAWLFIVGRGESVGFLLRRR